MREVVVNEQSRFPLAGIPHHSTILSFHHSNPPGAGWDGATGATDGGPNYAKQTQSWAVRRRAGP